VTRETRLNQLRRLIHECEQEIARLERREGVRTTTRHTTRVLQEVAREHDVTVVQILSRDRHRITVRARQDAAYALREQLGLSFPQIARILERDHTTIQYAVRQAAARRRPMLEAV
jgi:chromosomal replication initiation ATPase DnaA